MCRNIFLVISFTFLAIGASLASCTSPQNPIEKENCLPGTTGWTVQGIGDTTIQGFATDISVNAGSTINFKISTPASSYHIDIYRMGYYGGTGGRYITTIQPSATLPQTQPACLTDSTTKLLDCGNWGVSASWTVPATAVSGVYIAAPVRGDTGGASQMFFIVRNDSSHSDVIFQTSDETWQAYNPYGGHSLYGAASGFDLTNRAFKVSYNRPFNTINLEDVTFFFGTEYPMIRWLEADGYDVTYFTSVDTARNGALLANHKLYLSVGHDEYWSGPKRASVEGARAAGVNLAFFSGNETFWKTRWENSVDGSNTPFRTLVCYKETLGPNSNPPALAGVDPLDPPTWTGTWRDNSPQGDGGRPENSLQGTLFRVNGPGPDNSNLSIKVPAADGKMRLWRNTAVAGLSAGQTATLIPGSLGYEWDIDEDNGFRPAGLVDMSTSTYNLTTDYLLDNGGTYGAGTATHHLTLYRYYNNLGQPTQTPLGLIFGAGTVQWSWGLDANHAGSTEPVDPNMQQATINLFGDMGIQPATLQGGMILATKSADTQAPASSITAPGSGTTVQFGVPVTITGTASDSGGGLVGGVEVSTDGGKTWHAASGRESWSYSWTPRSSGSIQLLSRAVDDSANLEIPGSGATVTVPTLPVGIDVQVSADGHSSSTTLQSPAFSTLSRNELILAFINADYVSGTNTTVTSVSGAGLTWSLVTRSNGQSGTSEIWRAFASAPVSNSAVTATLSQSVFSSISVMSFTGVDTSGTNGSGAIGVTAAKNAASGAPTATLTTTRNYSWMFAVGNDYSNAIARTPGTGQSLVHQYLTSTGDTYWVQMQNSPTFVAGTNVTSNDTAPTGDKWNLAVVEVLPGANGSLSISGTVTAAGSGATVSLSGVVNTSVLADASGTYTFNNLPSGAYTITPKKAGITFSPASQNITLNTTNGTANFSTAVLQAIAVTPTTPTVLAGSTQQFTATGTYSDGSTQNVTAQVAWSSSPTSVATIASSGLASALAGGSASITAALTVGQTSVSGNATLTVQVTAVVIGTTSLPNAFQNQPYSAALNATGGTAPYSWSLAQGTLLPQGLTLSPNGQITGTPNATGTTTFTVQVTDSGSPVQTRTQQLTLTVAPAPTAFTIWSPATVPGTIDVGGASCSSCALVQATNSGGTNTTTDPTTYVSPTTDGDFLVVFHAHSGWTGSGTTTISDTAGNVWHPCNGTGTGPFTDVRVNATFGMSCHYATNIIGSNDTVTVLASDCAGGCSFVGASYLEYSGVASTAVAAWDAYAANGSAISTTGSNNSSCGSVSPTQNNDLVICGLDEVLGNVTAGTTPVNFGSLDQPGVNVAVEHVVWPSLGPINPTMSDSVSNDAYAGITLAVKGNSTGSSGAELGVKFKSDVNGSITGIRFYKSNANTGTHIGNLWSSTGTLLASATFTNETASGWQQVTFSPAVQITGNTVYVASYHTNVGHYSADQNYFSTAGADNSPLHALQNGISGSNGVFALSSSSSFPANGSNASNYWVDVVFLPSVTLSSIAVTPISPTIQPGSTQAFTATGTYSDGSTQNISSQVTWSSSKTAVATINSSGLASALVGGSTSIGAVQGSVSGNTVLTVQPATLTITTTALTGGIQNQAYSATLAATGGTPPLSWSLANPTTLPAGLSLSTGGQITGTPTGSGTTTFTVQVADSATTPQVATAVLSIAVAPNACPCTISGTISGTGGPQAKVTLSGTAAATTTADSAGAYSFKSLGNGSYTVTPSLSGFSFNPSSQAVTIAGADPTPVSFTSAAIPPILSVSPLTIPMSATQGGSNPAPASFTVSNTGFGTLSFTASSDSTWLSVSPASGTAPQAVQASANITGLAVGSYTGHITISAPGVQGSPATVTVNLTVRSVSSGIVIDATAVRDQNSAATSVTSATFSTTSANELLLAFIATDAKSSGITVTGVTGGGLTWALVGRTNAQLGTAEIWRAFASTTLTSVSVKATLSQNVTSSMTVMSFTGVDSTGTNGANAVGNVGSNNGATGAPTIQLTTTRNNSLLIAVGNDWDSAIAHTPGSGQTIVHQYLSPNGDSYWVQRALSPVPLSGTTAIVNDTSPTTDRWNLTVVEVRTP